MFNSYEDIFNNPFAPHPEIFENKDILPIIIIQNKNIVERQLEPEPSVQQDIHVPTVEPEMKPASEPVSNNLPVKSEVQYHVEDVDKKKPFWRK